MAFAARNLRILSKIYNGNVTNSYSTLRKPIARISLLPLIQNCKLTTQNNRTKIAGSLTNIRSSPTVPFAQNVKENTDNNQVPPKDDTDPDHQYEEEMRKQREMTWKLSKYSMISTGVILGLMGGFYIYDLSKTKYDDKGNVIEDEYSHLPYFPRIWNRLLDRINYWTKFIQEPSREQLLPDPLKHPYVHPPTIVLEFTDVLVHPEWTYKSGWRFKKRPGVDQFLESLSQCFEVVIFTAEPALTVAPVVDALDSKGIAIRLMRDATRFVDGHHVKDLDTLNRDLKKVIVVDWNPNSVKLHPANLFRIPRWKGNDDDTTLFHLNLFLKALAALDIEDMRDALTYYQQFDDPIEAFKANREKLIQQMKEDEMVKTQNESNKPLVSKWSPSFLKLH
ncbi:mitochondrial import inner membrane translocase subunit TIM50-C-like [Microplitis mediator]|uniref:mitochondrial import inner membrane translocase subunit TIM50-C-like n=1 Tax=Microplitis mediator TaxID=375433 RepID=UPI0025578BC8|nr:mitochondrial import inner membrane translocase subunit TIM50-C-like [Microplitis mediator]